MTLRRSLIAVPSLLALAALTACTAGSPAASTPTSDAEHSDAAGAAEVAEPPLALMSIDADGHVGMLDVLDGESSELASTSAPTGLTTDGRYGFVTTAEGLEIVDSGRWTWIHGDHNHYYLAEPRSVGVLDGEGEASVASGMLSTAGATGVFFGETGDAVLLDNASLSDGEIVEIFRLETGSAEGLIAPLGDGALVTDGDELAFYAASGTSIGASVPCAHAEGSITTPIALVVGCSDGAIVATWENSAPVYERVVYPGEIEAERATAFDGRKGRTTVAGAAGDTGFWVLDVRDRAWGYVATDVPIARVSAVGDEVGHVVAVDATGAVRVFLADSGEQVGATASLLPEVGPMVSLTVDTQRAYVNDPDAGVVYEIDFADGARIARTLETSPSPTFVAEVGR